MLNKEHANIPVQCQWEPENELSTPTATGQLGAPVTGVVRTDQSYSCTCGMPHGKFHSIFYVFQLP
jgi:hypothetical protein